MRIWYRNLDYLTIFAWAVLVVVGLVAIYSTTNGPSAEYLLESVRQNFWRQLAWVVISLGAGLACLFLPVHFFQRIAWVAYLGTLILLAVALLFGREVNGARSWLHIGGLSLQVSEVAKVGAVLAGAQLISTMRPNSSRVKYAVLLLGVFLTPMALILLQNDAGTALVFFAIAPIALFWSIWPAGMFIVMAATGIAGYFSVVHLPTAITFSVLFTLFVLWKTRERLYGAMAAAFSFGSIAAVLFALNKIFRPHQVARILSFTNPGAEEFRSGVGFHLVQSKAAIGSGGLAGKGFMEGTQTQGAYVPEQSTDFVFSIIGEEWGFIGSMVVISMFALLLVRVIQMGIQIKHPFGSMAAVGIAGIYLVHVFVNIGMVVGLLPVIGIPLPFVSYGGSAMLANTVLLAILLNLHMRRDDFPIYVY